MIEKVVNQIDELDQPHLKLMVMHDFRTSLRNRPPTGPMSTEIETGTPDVIFELWIPRSMTSPRMLLAGPFDLANQQFVNTLGTRP